MSVIDELIPLLKKLKLSGVLHSLELRLGEAVEDNLAFEEFLFRLLKDEIERRDAKQLHQRGRRANFEHRKTLEDFDESPGPGNLQFRGSSSQRTAVGTDGRRQEPHRPGDRTSGVPSWTQRALR